MKRAQEQKKHKKHKSTKFSQSNYYCLLNNNKGLNLLKPMT